MKKSLVLLPIMFILPLSSCTIEIGDFTSQESKESAVSVSSIESVESTQSVESVQSESSVESIESVESTTSNSSSIQYTGSYYNSIDSSKTGSALLADLQTLMFSTHNKYCSYGEIRYKFKDSDKDPKKSGNIICFYSHQSISGTWDSGATYNREHVWPKASSGGLYNDMGSNYNNYVGAGSDLHHIRPAKTDINEGRGSTKFGNYKPEDFAKGDCARICLYLYMHYSTSVSGTGSLKSTYAGNLILTNVFTSISVLKEWNRLDPVDELEMARNNYIQTYQGNRNPFIDHPEWVDVVI